MSKIVVRSQIGTSCAIKIIAADFAQELVEIFYADVHLELCFEAGTELFVVTAVVGVVSKVALVHESDFASQIPSSIWRLIWRFWSPFRAHGDTVIYNILSRVSWEKNVRDHKSFEVRCWKEG